MHNVDGLAKRFGIDHEEYEQIIEELLEQFENNIQNIEYSIFRNETFHPKE